MTRTPRAVASAWQPDAGLLDGLMIGAVALDAEGVVIYANASARSLFGSPPDDPEDLVGSDARTRLFEDPERAVVDEVLAVVEATGSWTGELAIRCGGQATTRLSTSWTPLTRPARSGGAVVLLETSPGGEGSAGAVAAVPSPSGRRLRRLAAVTSELLAAASVAEVSAIVTDHMMSAADALVASISLLVDDQTLALMGISGGRTGLASRWATYPLASATPAAESVRTGQSLWVEGAEIARRYPSLEPLGPPNRTILCLPLVVSGGRVLGVVTLTFPHRRRLDEAERLFLRLLVDTCAMTIDRLQAQRSAMDREAKLTFLAEVSATLTSDLDFESTLVAVAESAVPGFADWCAIALDEDGVLRTISIAHAHPDLIDLVTQLQERYPSDPASERGVYRVLRTGESELVPEVSDERLMQFAQDAEHLRLMRQLNMRSGMTCALKVADRTFGVITWVAGEEGRRFTEDDLALGEDLARRAAVAIDNSQLHSQIRDSALELQRAVLPESLPALPGWTSAVVYLPAGRTDAGGDFYDVLELEDGRVAMFVGDVMGRGVAAASVMAQMRSAIRTLIAVDPAPAAVLAGMDRVFEALHLEQLVTMVYAIADPALDHLQVINAGHPSPVLLAADGQVEVLEHPSTLILGAGGGDRAILSAQFGPGDSLLLYTDGLIERRHEDYDDAMARLIVALHPPRTGTPDAWLGELVEELRDPTRDDDVAALWVARDRA